MSIPEVGTIQMRLGHQTEWSAIKNEGTHIRFQTGTDESDWIEINLSDRGGVLVRGGWVIRIYPEAGNAVRIEAAP